MMVLFLIFFAITIQKATLVCEIVLLWTEPQDVAEKMLFLLNVKKML